MKDTCPIEGCKRARNGEMCKPHWFTVPRELRDRVWSTYRAWKDDYADVEKMKAYSAASRDARRAAEDA